MSLLWRLFQQIARWLHECPQVRVEHISPAAKHEQIKGQWNPLELEVRFLCARQRFSWCTKQSAWNLDWGLIFRALLLSELSSQSALGFVHFMHQGTLKLKIHNTHWYWTVALHCSNVKVRYGEFVEHRGWWSHKQRMIVIISKELRNSRMSEFVIPNSSILCIDEWTPGSVSHFCYGEKVN